MHVISLATVDDVDALVPLVGAYRAFYRQQPDAQRERAYIDMLVRGERSTIVIARADEDIVGFAQLFATWSTVALAPSLILEDLYVRETHRGSGIARALLDRACEHARHIGAAGMFLETAMDNHVAQRVYEGAGWTREARFYKYNAPMT